MKVKLLIIICILLLLPFTGAEIRSPNKQVDIKFIENKCGAWKQFPDGRYCLWSTDIIKLKGTWYRTDSFHLECTQFSNLLICEDCFDANCNNKIESGESYFIYNGYNVIFISDDVSAFKSRLRGRL